MASDAEKALFLKLFKGSLIPLRTVPAGLTWILYDYFLTLEDEITYIWSQKPSMSKYLYLWVRYYTIALLIFDVTQIHLFSRPGITNNELCVAMDSIIRVVGAISLWSVEIIMQLRVFALYQRSTRVAVFNGICFLGSIAGFLWVLIYNAQRRHAVIANAIKLPLPGCPSIHSGIEWAQWVPATAFEGVLFGFAVYKSVETAAHRARKGETISLYTVLLRDNVLYFFGIACLLVFNNLMVVGITKIPWFSYGPFHAAIGILTCRMLINLRKALVAPEPAKTSRVPRRRGISFNESWHAASKPVPSMGTTDSSGYSSPPTSSGSTNSATFSRPNFDWGNKTWDNERGIYNPYDDVDIRPIP